MRFMFHALCFMRIGIDARMWGEKQTGIGLYIENLTRYLLKIDKQNQYVLFLKKDFFDSLIFSEQNARKVLADYHWYSYGEQLFFPRVLKKEKLDMAHFPNFNAPIFYNGKKIVTIHDMTTHDFPGHKSNSGWRKFAFRRVFKNSIEKSDRVIAVSGATKNQIVENYNIADSKVKAIYSGLPNKNYESGIKNYEKDSKPYIFFTGVWRKHKNIVNLIEAFAILRDKYEKNIQLVLGGQEDEFYNEPRKVLEKLKLGGDVIIPGFIPKNEMPMFFTNASVFVFPSFAEGFGFAPLEAMSYSVPCAVSDIPALRESCGKAALYFDPHSPEDMASKIALLLNNENLRKDLIQKGLENIEKYDWIECARKTLGAYKSVI